MSIKIMSLVWDTEIGPATKRLVMLALADAANDEGSCFLLIKTLARKAVAGESTVQRVLGELESDGLLTREFRANRSTIFHLKLGAIRSQIGTGSQIETTPPPNRDPQASQIETHNRPSNQQQEPTTAAPEGAEQQPATPHLQAVPDLDQKQAGKDEGPRPRDANAEGLTVNQRATRLAQDHYDRLGGFGNVAAWTKIIRKALDHGYSPDTTRAALDHIADHNWTLTEERLANTLKGGPRRASGPPPVQRQARHPQAAGTRPADAVAPTPSRVEGY